MKKILIFGVGWEQLPLVIKAKDRGLFVVVTTWWDKEKIPADKVYEVDSRDLDALENIVENEKPDFLLADECDYSMYAVSYFSEKYHLPGPCLGTQTITNNKFLQRECVKNTSVLQPAYCLCWDMQMGLRFADEIGYPVVIKPIDNRGSIGVSKVMSQEEFGSAWLQGVAHSHSRLCIVEKCINGDVITADGFCDSKKFEFIAASTKDMYENNSNVAKILYYPGKIEERVYMQIKQCAEQVVYAIGMKYGFVHIEFILEKQTGDIYLVEAANRGGGVFISDIILEKITGIDYVGALLDLAMGKKIEIQCNQNYIANAMLYFLELQGDCPVSNCIETMQKECTAVYVNAYRKGGSVSSDASVGRQGVIVYVGQDFGKMLEKGKKFEKKYCADTEEFFHLF